MQHSDTFAKNLGVMLFLAALATPVPKRHRCERNLMLFKAQYKRSIAFAERRWRCSGTAEGNDAKCAIC
jgi:hypothetical protein